MCFRKFSMQICAAIIEKYIFSYSSVNITDTMDNGTKRVSKSMFCRSKKSDLM